MQVKAKVKELARNFAVTESDIIPTSSETKQGRDEVLAKMEYNGVAINSD
jgi:hypothetical protein